MSIIRVNTAFNIDLSFRLAPLTRRVLAMFLDMLVVSVYGYVVQRFVIGGFNDNSLQTASYIFILGFPSFLYHLLLEIFLNGQSLGKKWMGLKVISLNGEQPSVSQYLLRFLLGLGNYMFFLIPYITMYFLQIGFFAIVGFLVVFLFYLPDVICLSVTARGQRLGDLAAGTTVIDSRHKTTISDTIFQTIDEATYTPIFPQVMQLTDRDINRINMIIRQHAKTKSSSSYVVDVTMRIKDHLQIQSDAEPINFLKQLMKDYNWLSQK